MLSAFDFGTVVFMNHQAFVLIFGGRDRVARGYDLSLEAYPLVRIHGASRTWMSCWRVLLLASVLHSGASFRQLRQNQFNGWRTAASRIPLWTLPVARRRLTALRLLARPVVPDPARAARSDDPTFPFRVRASPVAFAEPRAVFGIPSLICRLVRRFCSAFVAFSISTMARLAWSTARAAWRSASSLIFSISFGSIIAFRERSAWSLANASLFAISFRSIIPSFALLR